jgi:hypothetical protein
MHHETSSTTFEESMCALNSNQADTDITRSPGKHEEPTGHVNPTTEKTRNELDATAMGCD